MNFLSSPSMWKNRKGGLLWVLEIVSSLLPALGICPDLQLLVSSRADLWWWHMSCVGEDWAGSRGDKREWSWSVAQSESESALVSKDGHVWPKTQTEPRPLISAQKHLLGVADGEASARTFHNVEEHRGFKAALKFLGCGEGSLYGGEQEREWWGRGEDCICRFSPCKADLAEAKPSFPSYCRKPFTLFLFSPTQ